jgi:hypothetical protein
VLPPSDSAQTVFEPLEHRPLFLGVVVAVVDLCDVMNIWARRAATRFAMTGDPRSTILSRCSTPSRRVMLLAGRCRQGFKMFASIVCS